MPLSVSQWQGGKAGGEENSDKTRTAQYQTVGKERDHIKSLLNVDAQDRYAPIWGKAKKRERSKEEVCERGILYPTPFDSSKVWGRGSRWLALRRVSLGVSKTLGENFCGMRWVLLEDSKGVQGGGRMCHQGRSKRSGKMAKKREDKITKFAHLWEIEKEKRNSLRSDCPYVAWD